MGRRSAVSSSSPGAEVPKLIPWHLLVDALGVVVIGGFLAWAHTGAPEDARADAKQMLTAPDAWVEGHLSSFGEEPDAGDKVSAMHRTLTPLVDGTEGAMERIGADQPRRPLRLPARGLCRANEIYRMPGAGGCATERLLGRREAVDELRRQTADRGLVEE